MKTLTGITFLLLSMTAFAQNPYVINDPAMQKMMKEMQKYEMCMASIQQSKFIEIQLLQEKFEEEVSPLCASGNRDKAQKRAIKFGKEMSNHPVFKQINKCSKLVISELAKEELDNMDFDYETSDTHVCDEM
ncbi:MAG: hypothetical protein DIZ80_08130 [endosymbiont of Galathealinum brachiosum]|uniref:Uncharacterized protein n=1 Tax=endosymbiont of Galathealinum brachiosum TaxID=2200906 RepID=A0A370DHT6_9GAMM|nr:MAG: hypothetical protein DIZ80_08130 [endosymbiont of Galathealinum brachiosum]